MHFIAFQYATTVSSLSLSSASSGAGSLLQRGRLCGQPSDQAESKLSKWSGTKVEKTKKKQMKQQEERNVQNELCFFFWIRCCWMLIWPKNRHAEQNAHAWSPGQAPLGSCTTSLRSKEIKGNQMQKNGAWTLTQRSNKKRSWNSEVPGRHGLILRVITARTGGRSRFTGVFSLRLFS